MSILDGHDRALRTIGSAHLPPDCDAMRLHRSFLDSERTLGDMTWEFADTDPWRVYDVAGEHGKADANADVRTSFTRIARWRAVLLVAQAAETAQAELSAVLGLPLPAMPSHRDRFERLLPETRRDARLAVLGDRASRRRRRRKARTLHTRQQRTQHYGQLARAPGTDGARASRSVTRRLRGS